jgi:hypothetical protein
VCVKKVISHFHFYHIMNQNTLKTALRLVAVAVILFAAATERSEAQGGRPRRFSLGLYGSYGMDMHSANFLDLPNNPVFTPRTGGTNEPGPFTGTTSWNPVVGIVMEYLLDERLSVGLRAHYATQNARLTTRANYRVGRDDGTFADATSEYAISDSIQIIGLEPMASYNVWEGLSVHLGVRLNFATSARYNQSETLIAPADGSFFGGTTPIRTRNVTVGDLPNANTFTIAPIVGLSYAIPIIDRLTVQPEVFFSYGLMPVVRDLQWTVNSLRPGLAVKYKF